MLSSRVHIVTQASTLRLIYQHTNIDSFDEHAGVSAAPVSFPIHPPAGSEIFSLPGWSGALPSRHFADYIDIADGTKHLYYYLTTSILDPAAAPLVL